MAAVSDEAKHICSPTINSNVTINRHTFHKRLITGADSKNYTEYTSKCRKCSEPIYQLERNQPYGVIFRWNNKPLSKDMEQRLIDGRPLIEWNKSTVTKFAPKTKRKAPPKSDTEEDSNDTGDESTPDNKDDSTQHRTKLRRRHREYSEAEIREIISKENVVSMNQLRRQYNCGIPRIQSIWAAAKNSIEEAVRVHSGPRSGIDYKNPSFVSPSPLENIPRTTPVAITTAPATTTPHVVDLSVSSPIPPLIPLSAPLSPTPPLSPIIATKSPVSTRAILPIPALLPTPAVVSLSSTPPPVVDTTTTTAETVPPISTPSSITVPDALTTLVSLPAPTPSPPPPNTTVLDDDDGDGDNNIVMQSPLDIISAVSARISEEGKGEASTSSPPQSSPPPPPPPSLERVGMITFRSVTGDDVYKKENERIKNLLETAKLKHSNLVTATKVAYDEVQAAKKVAFKWEKSKEVFIAMYKCAETIGIKITAFQTNKKQSQTKPVPFVDLLKDP